MPRTEQGHDADGPRPTPDRLRTLALLLWDDAEEQLRGQYARTVQTRLLGLVAVVAGKHISETDAARPVGGRLAIQRHTNADGRRETLFVASWSSYGSALEWSRIKLIEGQIGFDPRKRPIVERLYQKCDDMRDLVIIHAEFTAEASDKAAEAIREKYNPPE